MWRLLLNLIPLLATGYSDLRLNPILNASAVALDKENGVSEYELNETHKICTKPDVVYQSAGPINIYLNGGLVQQGGSTINLLDIFSGHHFLCLSLIKQKLKTMQYCYPSGVYNLPQLV